MRIFEKECKINFVDEADVYVGYDTGLLCCEDWGYFFSNSPPPPSGTNWRGYEDRRIELNPEDLEPFFFDPEFFVLNPWDASDSGHVAFRLVRRRRTDRETRHKHREAVSEGGGYFEEIFLVLYNFHNGYYSHGFKCTVGDKVIQEGSI